jgi:hypothetical protein
MKHWLTVLALMVPWRGHCMRQRSASSSRSPGVQGVLAHGSTRTTGWHPKICASACSQPAASCLAEDQGDDRSARCSALRPRQLELDKIKATRPARSAAARCRILAGHALVCRWAVVLRDGKDLGRALLEWAGSAGPATAAWRNPTVALPDGCNGGRPGQALAGPVDHPPHTRPWCSDGAAQAVDSAPARRRESASIGRHRTSMTGWRPVDGTPATTPEGFGRGSISRAVGKGTFPPNPCSAKSDLTPTCSSGHSPKAYRVPLARTFCQELFEKLRPENSALWLTDSQGTELSAGLALSLRDFARLGQLLIDARNSSRRSKIPNWFIETLTASAGLRTANSSELAGLQKGKRIPLWFCPPWRSTEPHRHYRSLRQQPLRRFRSPTGDCHFCSLSEESHAGMRATLEQVWDALGSATQPSGKR